MTHMTNTTNRFSQLGSGVLVLFLGITAFAVACTGLTARQKVLLPAIRATWPAVKADLERGVPPRTDDIAALDAALAAGDPVAVRLVPWPMLDESARAGFAARVTGGEITEGVAVSLRERLKNFGEALTTFTAR